MVEAIRNDELAGSAAVADVLTLTNAAPYFTAVN